MTSHGELAERTDQYTGLYGNTAADRAAAFRRVLKSTTSRDDEDTALWMLGLHYKPDPTTKRPRSWTGHLLAPQDGAA